MSVCWDATVRAMLGLGIIAVGQVAGMALSRVALVGELLALSVVVPPP